MREFIHLQLKLRWGLNRDDNKKSAILTSFAGLLVFGVMLVLIWMLTKMLANNIEEVTPKKLSLLFLTAIMIGLTVMGVSMQLKRMYRPSDLLITARFPISPYKIYLANLILIYMELAIYSVVLILPILLVSGLAQGAVTFTYIIGMILGAFFAPMIPFALSTLIAIPVMYVATLLENRNVIKIIMFIIVLAGFFVLYNIILNELANYFTHGSSDSIGVWEKVLNALGSIFNPASYLAGIIFFDGAWLGLGVTVGLSLVLATAGIFAARPLYARVRIKMLEHGGSAFRRRTKVDDCGAGYAMLRHGFKEILRTRTYAYFYLGIAIATPVMVFFCNNLITEVGKNMVGGDINFGASVLVITAFMAMISAFSGNVLSMEGKNFYITKLVPVSFKMQLLIKAFLNLCVSIGALLVSCIILAVLKFVTPVEMIIMIVGEVLLTIGFVFNGINLNLANPNLRMKASGEADEINITLMMILGIVISAIVGAVSIIIPVVLQSYVAYIIINAVAVIYAAINVTIFILTATRKYNRIEI